MLLPGIAPSERKIVALDPAKCLTPKSNREIRDDELAELLEDIRVNGQLFPGLAAPHPTLAGFYEVACGNRRKRCQEILEKPFLTEVRDAPFAAGEVVALSIGDHLKRKNPNVFQLNDEVTAYKREMGLETWAEVADQLRLSPPTLSRILGVKRYTAELRALTDGLGGTIIQMIGKLETHEMMRRALEFASAPGGNGRLPSKEQVEMFLRTLKRDRKPAGKRKTLAGKIDGRTMGLSLNEGDSTERIAAWLEALAAKFKRFKDLPPESLGGLFS